MWRERFSVLFLSKFRVPTPGSRFYLSLEISSYSRRKSPETSYNDMALYHLWTWTSNKGHIACEPVWVQTVVDKVCFREWMTWCQKILPRPTSVGALAKWFPSKAYVQGVDQVRHPWSRFAALRATSDWEATFKVNVPSRYCSLPRIGHIHGPPSAAIRHSLGIPRSRCRNESNVWGIHHSFVTRWSASKEYPSRR